MRRPILMDDVLFPFSVCFRADCKFFWSYSVDNPLLCLQFAPAGGTPLHADDACVVYKKFHSFVTFPTCFLSFSASIQVFFSMSPAMPAFKR